MSLNEFKKITSFHGDSELDSQHDIEKYTDAVEKDSGALKIMTDYQKGVVYFFICGSLRDERKALRLLKKAADSGLPKAMYMYGFACHHMSLNSGHDPERKQEYLDEFATYMKKAIQNGNADAMVFYGKSLLNLPDNSEEEKAGIRFLEAAAEKGSAEAKKYLKEYRNKTHYEFPERDLSDNLVIGTLANQVMDQLSFVDTKSGQAIKEIITGIYSDQGYQWIDYDEYIGSILTKNQGDSFLITEDELWDIYFELMELTDQGSCIKWCGENGLPYEVPICLMDEKTIHTEENAV